MDELLEETMRDLCKELALWQDDIPAVVLNEVQRLVNGLQNMCYRVRSLAPAVNRGCLLLCEIRCKTESHFAVP